MRDKRGEKSSNGEEPKYVLSMRMEKLELLGIFKESVKIPYKNPKFIFLTFLTSLPLVFVMVLHEIILQTTMVETKAFLTPPPPPPAREYLWSGEVGIYNSEPYYYSMKLYYYSFETLDTAKELFQYMSPKVLQMVFLYFIPLHLLDLINTITTVNSASTIYTNEKLVNIKEMLLKLIDGKRVKGALITSVYVLSLNAFVMLGLIWAATNIMIPWFIFSSFLYGIVSIVALVKWMEWSAIWNMSIVLSVLEEREGVEALGISGYFSRRSKRRGLCLMLVFFAWRAGLRLTYLFVGGNRNWSALVVTSVLSCVGNVMKWVVCTVYFYDCKNCVLEKKVDVEEGISQVDIAAK